MLKFSRKHLFNSRSVDFAPRSTSVAMEISHQFTSDLEMFLLLGSVQSDGAHRSTCIISAASLAEGRYKMPEFTYIIACQYLT